MTSPELAAWVLLGGIVLIVVAVVIAAVTLFALILQTRTKPAAVQPAGVQIVPAAAEQARLEAEQARLAAEQAKQVAEQEAQTAKAQAATGWQWYHAAVAEVEQLCDRLSAITDIEAREYADVTVPGLRHPGFAGQPLHKHLHTTEELLREAVQITRTRIAASARAGVRSTADEVQMFLTRLQIKIDEALNQFSPDSPYTQSLIGIDHEATLARHSVQRLRILAGSWPGAQWGDLTFREIVEGARGRIGPHDRVTYLYRRQEGEALVEGRIAEPITVVLAELLANATSYSSGPVEVRINEMSTGYRIEVEDNGLGMNAFQLEAAERLLSQRTILDVASLKDESKLGFAIIGRLASEFGISVSVSHRSTYGGVKATCLIPRAFITPAPPAQEPAEPAVAPHPAQPAQDQPLAAVSPSTANGNATTPLGLPRRRRRTDAVPSSPGLLPQEAITDTLTPEDASDGFARLQNALRQGNNPTDHDTQGHVQP
ncbi:ATP-binding protein [Nonomuraea sp. SYSU D8015]|uniref:ATP-binding protein n=1 Tax=Nonomuraea sp. SYSU D8015 TaxID=2593644 RepID=UPI0016612062|nr:ATP-binding protein [Nonomuraea sp. SYSU D8015]